MKKSLFTIACAALIAAAVSVGGAAYDRSLPFMLYEGRKIEMNYVYDRACVVSDERSSEDLLDALTAINGRIASVKKINGSGVWSVLFAKPLSDKSYLSAVYALSKARGVKFAQPVYSIGEKELLYPNGELFVKFKHGTTFNDVTGFAQKRGLKRLRSLDFSPFVHVFEIDGASQIALDAANAAHSSPIVEWAAFEFAHNVQKKFVPNDPLFPDQWHLRNDGQNGAAAGADVKADAAWDKTMGDGAVIAVVDDGVDCPHPDLAPNCLDGYDYVDNDDDPAPGEYDGHGTCVAGAAAAKGDNAVGVSGVCPNCKIIPIRLLGEYLLTQDEANAFVFAVKNGAWVISNSWGVPDNNRAAVPIPKLTAEAIDYALHFGRGGLGTLVVFAAGNGNEPVSTDGYPAYKNSIAVAASTDEGVRSDYSDYGAEIEINAPSSGGINGVTTVDNLGSSGYSYGDYADDFGGTSSAAPLASGVYALIMSVRPDLSWKQIKKIARDTADKIDRTYGAYDQNGRSNFYGYGRINAQKAVDAALAFDDGCVPELEICDARDDDCDGLKDEGLVCYACAPTEEICDGMDDDCDGYVDEEGVCEGGKIGICMTCAENSDCLDGVCVELYGDTMHKYCVRRCNPDRTCPNPALYACSGSYCLPRNKNCDQTQCLGRAELCNNRDDNCNSQSDEGGVCCVPTDPPDEVCDGVDNDCDGKTDNVDVSKIPPPIACLNKGVCEGAAPACDQAVWVCKYPQTYEPEELSCDGKDNDCDGTEDEGCAQPDGDEETQDEEEDDNAAEIHVEEEAEDAIDADAVESETQIETEAEMESESTADAETAEEEIAEYDEEAADYSEESPETQNEPELADESDEPDALELEYADVSKKKSSSDGCAGNSEGSVVAVILLAAGLIFRRERFACVK